MSPPWLAPVLSVFVGCCLNVIFLEYIVRDDPSAGNLITFCQFLFVSLEGLVYHARHGLIHTRQIPLKHYMGLVGAFFLTSILNNFVFGFKISLPLHMIFRSGSLVTNMILGMLLLKKRYPLSKVLSVGLVTVGIAVCTLASAKPQQAAQTHSTAAEASDLLLWLTGITILVVCLFISSLLGIYQELLNTWYGNSWRESLFYSHFLALPWFLTTAAGLLEHASIFSASPPLSFSVALPLPPSTLKLHALDVVCSTLGGPASGAGNSLVSSAFQLLSDVFRVGQASALPLSTCTVTFPIPRLWAFMLLNAATQYICVRGVFELTSVTSSLVVTLTVTLRKFASLLLSILYFHNEFTANHWFGTALLFLGTMIFLDLTPWRKPSAPRPSAANETERKPSEAQTSSTASESVPTASQPPARQPLQPPAPATSSLRGITYYAVLITVGVLVSTLGVTLTRSQTVAMIVNFVWMLGFSRLTKIVEQVQGNEELPSFAMIIARAFLTVLRPRPSASTRFEQIEITARNLRVERESLRQYRELCGYATPTSRAFESVCFLEIMSLPLQGLIITHPRFPISAFGLIHVRNDIVQHQPVDFEASTDAEFDFRASISGYRWTDDYGLEVAMLVTAARPGSDEVIWKCVATVLARAQTLERKRPVQEKGDSGKARIAPISEWNVPANTGVLYASMSGDYNPHHLYPWTAKLIGYSRPIAHGMYSLARSVAELTSSRKGGTQASSLFPFALAVEFKRPLYMPAQKVQLVSQGRDTPRGEGSNEADSAPLVGLAHSSIESEATAIGKSESRFVSFALLSSEGVPHLRAAACPEW